MIDTTLAQKIFGVLNTTEDSFFDGGKYLAPQKAITRAKELLLEGAGVLDLGAASSHPDAKDITAAEEITRIKPVLDFCKKKKIKISIDSCLADVQVYAIAQEVDFLNDVTGFSNPSIYDKIAAHSCKLILMHAVQGSAKADKKERFSSAQLEKENILPQIIDFFGKRILQLTQAGIARNRIILDTGMGFFLSPNPEISFEVLQKISEIKKNFQLPLLLGLSRKSFLQKTLQKNVEEVGAYGAYLETLLLEKNVDYIRTHSPEFLQNFALLRQKITP